MPIDSQEPLVAPEGQTPAELTTAGTPPASTPEPEPKTFDEAYVKTLRSEAASLRTKLKSFETEAETRATAAMSDLEKAQKAATDAEARATATEQRIAKRDALYALKAASIVDPDLAFLAIKDEIVMENGEPQNIALLVSEFVKTRPAMVKPAAPVAPETKSTNPTPAPSRAQSREFVGRF